MTCKNEDVFRMKKDNVCIENKHIWDSTVIKHNRNNCIIRMTAPYCTCVKNIKYIIDYENVENGVYNDNS